MAIIKNAIPIERINAVIEKIETGVDMDALDNLTDLDNIKSLDYENKN